MEVSHSFVENRTLVARARSEIEKLTKATKVNRFDF